MHIFTLQVIGCQENGTGKHLGDTDHEIKCLRDPDQSPATPIDDILSFKSSCKHLPHTKVVS